MQSKLRTKIAAAALMLAPVAALVAAQPAAAQWGVDDHRYEQGRDWRDNRDFHPGVRRDYRAPDIYNVTPEMDQRVGSRVATRVSAHYRDGDGGVDGRFVRLRLDGSDVTRWAHADDNDIRFSANLRPGRHFAEVEVVDRAGHVARRSWSFTVIGEGEYL